MILTNNKSYFKHSETFVTRVPDIHKLIATATKTNFVKSKPKTEYYQDYGNFDADMFDKSLNNGLRNMHSFTFGLPRVSKNISG